MFNSSFSSGNLSYSERLKRINYFIIFLILVLFSFGLLALYSVAEGNFNSWPKNHLYRFLIGLLLIFFLNLLIADKKKLAVSFKSICWLKSSLNSLLNVLFKI